MRSKFGGLATLLSLALLSYDGDDQDDDSQNHGEGDPDIVLGLVVVDGVVAVLLHLLHELLLFLLLWGQTAALECSLYKLSAALFALFRVLELLALLGHRLLKVDQELLRCLVDDLLVDLDVRGAVRHGLQAFIVTLAAEHLRELLLALNELFKTDLS